jgi:signal transduction histidine kinase
MFARLDHSQLLRYAGLFTWAVIAIPLILLSLAPTDTGAGAEDVAAVVDVSWPAWAAYAAFGLCYGWLTRGLGGRRVAPLDYLLLVVLTGSAVAISYYSDSGLGSVLLMVAACVLPWLLPLPMGVAWLVLSELLVVPVYVRGLGFSWFEAVMQSLLYVGFSGFVFVTSLVARQQARAREDQHRLNAEFRATRALLAESARVNERTRISRELHDLLGHHLTALSLNLEVAGHLVQGTAQEHVTQAHTLAKLLLSDVREAVSRLRTDDAIDMAATLRPLAENTAGLRVLLDLPDPFLLDDAERAHVLLRCTQEIITNTQRHAQASELRLRYRVTGRSVRLKAADDGRGADAPVAGNGLRGMRERLAAYGGRVDLSTRPGEGFALVVHLPLDDHPVALAAPVSATPDPAPRALAGEDE